MSNSVSEIYNWNLETPKKEMFLCIELLQYKYVDKRIIRRYIKNYAQLGTVDHRND